MGWSGIDAPPTSTNFLRKIGTGWRALDGMAAPVIPDTLE
jgi:hypothetical protein